MTGEMRIPVGRVPVLTLWAAIVSARIGHPRADKSGEDLRIAFGVHLDEAQKAMEALADRYTPEELRQRSYDLYRQFRPANIRKGMLDIDKIGDAE